MSDKKAPKQHDQQIIDLTNDLQRTRADFENYRKRVNSEKEIARNSGRISAVLQLLPVIDNIERAITHLPAELKGNKWAEGVTGLTKHLEKSLKELGLTRIDATPGVNFNPEVHEAVQFDETGDSLPGSVEIIAEELQAGYKLGGDVLRPSMVKVTHKDTKQK